MSHLLDKSEQNKAAANFLKERGIYASSVHCGYYSCIQMFIHLLIKHFNEEFEKEVENSKGGKGNLHSIYINELTGRLQIKTKKRVDCVRDKRDIRGKMMQLREFRLQSDYHDEAVTEQMAEKAHNYTEEIQKLVKRHISI